jgi:phosphoglycerol transferase MdoB-like AlkP superfamily enzyme
MKTFLQVISRILLLDFIFLILMSVFRGIFLLYYGQGIDFSGLTFDILKVFYMGARYDLAVISYLNMPVIIAVIVLLFIGKNALFDKFLSAAKIYYTIFFGLVFVFLCIDFGFYSYFQNHLNILIYGLFEDDTKALISTLNENYNLFLIILGFAALFAICFFTSKKILRLKNKSVQSYQQRNSNKIALKVVISIVLVFLNFISARGSFGTFPLEVDMTGMAEVSKNTFLNKTAVNGFYTLQAAMAARNREKRRVDLAGEAGYKNDIRQAFADYLNKSKDDIPVIAPEDSLIVKIPFNKEIENVRPNVILIVMESFGSSLLKYNSKDFDLLGELKKHFDEDIVFYNFFPASDGTMVSLESIVTNLARRPGGTVLSQTEYAYKKYKFGAPAPYKAKGYETYFIYGGGAGWRNIDVFLENLGFDEVLGSGAMDSDYPRNQWGVYDEYLFDFVFKTLDKGSKQKFIGVLTTTNHPPFSLPKDYKNLPLNPPSALRDRTQDKELAQMRYAAYQYACRALGDFITKIKNSKYGENTIIAVTGDHSFWSLFEYSNAELEDKISVPFYLYIPKKLRPKKIDTTVFGSHLDIMPTLYSLSLSDVKVMAMGKNIFADSDNIAYNDSGFLADKKYAVQYSLLNKKAIYYIYDKGDISKPRLIKESQEQQGHKKLIRHYLPMIAISDYLIKNTGE